MKCPFCNEFIEGKSCSFCSRENPSDAVCCAYCGNAFEKDAASCCADSSEDEFPDIEDRELCPDGACTGIIINNKCTECGRLLNEI